MDLSNIVSVYKLKVYTPIFFLVNKEKEQLTDS